LIEQLCLSLHNRPADLPGGQAFEGDLRVGVSLAGGLAVPLFRFPRVFCDSSPLEIQKRQTLLRFGITLLGSPAVPPSRLA